MVSLWTLVFSFLLTPIMFLAVLLAADTARASIIYEMVVVGDPGNQDDSTGYGAVADSFQIMKYEFTNEQYTVFLNSVAATDTYGLYSTNMGSNARGGITRSGLSGSYTYAVKTDLGDKPVNYVSWFDAARVSNWLMNGATSASSTETGAYTLGGATSGNAPAVNPGATFSIPTDDQWYKAAYYKGGSTNAGYWGYATQSDTAPAAVTADGTGVGSAGSTGNFANYAGGAVWNGQNGNVTTVGSNGGASAYGAFDMSGNVEEWSDLAGAADSFRGLLGGSYRSAASALSSSVQTITPSTGSGSVSVGFRLASVVIAPVPEIDRAGTGSVLALITGTFGLLERRRRRRA